MGPSDARYIMPDIPLPDDWKNEGWHTGDYFPSPSERSRFSKSPSKYLSKLGRFFITK